jgi:flagellar hook-length control protein FliK
MSVGQMLLAFFSPDPRLGGLSEARESGEDSAADSFASLLASQNSGDLQAGLSALLPPNLPIGDDLSLASDGKTLPDTLALWMDAAVAGEEGAVVANGEGELDSSELTEGAQRWLQWLDSARAGLEQTQKPEKLTTEEGESQSSDPEGVAGGSVMAGPVLASAPAGALKPAAAGTQDALAAGITEASGKTERKDLPGEQAGRDAGNGRMQADQQAQAAPLQRTASVALAAEAQLANAQRMQDPETLTPRRSTSESEALDGLTRPGQTPASLAQAALTARPVNAPAQALGVPFGQPSWGEAMVEKVLWMSSQNVRSVEIRLDPAELGPLEIHIQNRGQENQVQFLSQNASVREALESQMFRLREMFTQQGMERVEVTVADGSQRDTAGGQTPGGGAESRGQSERAGREFAAESSQSIITTAAAAQVSSDRLVDYYA